MPKIINPSSEEVLYHYDYITREKLDEKIEVSKRAFSTWKNTSFEERKTLFKNLAKIMLEKKDELAKIDSLEMGMLFSGARGDVSKTASGVDYVAENFENWIKDIEFKQGGISGKRVFEPMGIIYTVSPWNFPYNQVFRNAVPNIIAGNVVLSKHASNVVGVARKIEELFLEAGFPEGVYQNIEIDSSKSEYIISNPNIRGTNLTGGDFAGRTLGSLAGKYLKPSILELGGNDPFILLDTKDIDRAVALAQIGRLSSCGQKCNSSKRFIILEEYYDIFCEKLVQSFSKLKVGDPFESDTVIGPLAKESSLKELEKLVEDTILSGGKLLLGGKALNRKGYYFPPTIVSDVKPGMTLFDEETFGPTAPIIKAKDINHAIELANNSKFGLTSAVITDSKQTFLEVASRLETGNVFHNKIPTSYPFLPYGGVKDSGYGKELGERGIKNFMNEKVIVY